MRRCEQRWTSSLACLYDLWSLRYELVDVSGSNPSVVTSLSADLNTQVTRSGVAYAVWPGGNPLIVDPDGDGSANTVEYSAGADALDPALRPSAGLSWEDLTGLGFSGREMVYSMGVAADDSTLWPGSSTNFEAWSFKPLEFLDATGVGGSNLQLHFRVTDISAAQRFFRSRTSSD